MTLLKGGAGVGLYSLHNAVYTAAVLEVEQADASICGAYQHFA